MSWSAFPLVASRHTARRLTGPDTWSDEEFSTFASRSAFSASERGVSTAVVSHRRPSASTGLDQPFPSSGVFQATFSLSPQDRGRSFAAGACPCPAGPRHWLQEGSTSATALPLVSAVESSASVRIEYPSLRIDLPRSQVFYLPSYRPFSGPGLQMEASPCPWARGPVGGRCARRHGRNRLPFRPGTASCCRDCRETSRQRRD